MDQEGSHHTLIQGCDVPLSLSAVKGERETKKRGRRRSEGTEGWDGMGDRRERRE